MMAVAVFKDGPKDGERLNFPLWSLPETVNFPVAGSAELFGTSQTDLQAVYKRSYELPRVRDGEMRAFLYVYRGECGLPQLQASEGEGYVGESTGTSEPDYGTE